MHGITVGSDGALWFAEFHSTHGNRIGKVTTAGVVTEFPKLTAGATPEDVTLGADGNVWFTELNGQSIGRITPAGTVTEFPLPHADSSPLGITSGPDGNLWFAENGRDRIGRMTTAGAVTGEFAVPSGSEPRGITTGPDGNLWLTQQSGNKVGEMTTSGALHEFNVPTTASQPDEIVTGLDGNLWFTESFKDKIGRIAAPSAAYALVLPSAFAPAPVTVNRGPLTWMFVSAGPHSAFDASSLGLFGSGAQQPVSYFTYAFGAAGTYRYGDNFSAAVGSVKVPVSVKPASGTATTSFALVWAAAIPPSPLVEDVQIKRPGGSYVFWKNGTTALGANFVPDAGTGTYQFRARLRNPSTTAASSYSPVVSIKVS